MGNAGSHDGAGTKLEKMQDGILRRSLVSLSKENSFDYDALQTPCTSLNLGGENLCSRAGSRYGPNGIALLSSFVLENHSLRSLRYDRYLIAIKSGFSLKLLLFAACLFAA
jgi:hypothetical protein